MSDKKNLEKKYSSVSTQLSENESAKAVPQPKKSNVCTFIGLFFLIVFLICMSVPAIYFFGKQSTHTHQYHPLSKVFENSTFKEVTKKLDKKANKYVNINGNWDDGLQQYAEYYADKRAEKGKKVIIRKYGESEAMQMVFETLRNAKNFIESYVDWEEDIKGSITWVFIIKGALPEKQINSIRQNHPKDRIITVMNKTSSSPTFKNVPCPSVDLVELRNQLAGKYSFTTFQLDRFFYFYKTSGQILKKFQMKTFSLRSFFGKNFFNMKNFTSLEKTTLQKLCKDGKSSYTGDKLNDLNAFVIHNGQLYWKERQAILFYEIQMKVICKDAIAPRQVLNEIKQQKKKEAELKKKKKESKKGKKTLDL